MSDEGKGPDLSKGRRAMYTRKVQENFPDELIFPKFSKKLSLRYGQNPGGPAAFYAEEGATGPNMATFEVLQEGKGLGFINVGDSDLAQTVVKTLNDSWVGEGLAACCIVKHEMPAAVALGNDSYNAFLKAWNSDSLSCFGGVHAFSREVDEKVAEMLIDSAKNVEVVYSPGYTQKALEVLSKRGTLRIIQMQDINLSSFDNGLNYKRVEGGMLVENRGYLRTLNPDDIEVVSKAKPSIKQIKAGLFNFLVAKYARSNALVFGSEDKTHGVGDGQMSRIDAADIALRKGTGANGRKSFYGIKGTIGASDAFMPEDDVVKLAYDYHAAGMIYPLGSINDGKVIDAGNERGMIMLATRRPGTTDCERAFLHR